MTADEYIQVARIALDNAREAEKRGAERARRRIRRAQAKALKLLRGLLRTGGLAMSSAPELDVIKMLDAATRAPRRRK